MSASTPAHLGLAPSPAIGPLREALRWLAYPAVVGAGLGLHAGLAAAGLPIGASAYLAVAVGSAAILLLERLQPFRPSWRPRGPELATDLLYLAAVQVALPVALGLAAASAGSAALASAGVAPSGLWPHAWPAAAQALLMLCLADALRFALHVAAHHLTPLWRLHAVHHSPAKLYALNVGRFHPLEKTLQYGLDALPFLLLGVGPEVLAFYFVFYALNGFFQHSNVELRLGWLNWLISGPELHRWHHSQRVEESSSNYGNNLIVWDVIFGTRFLPNHRSVGTLGLPNRRYPSRFAAQLLAPFVHGVEHSERFVPRWRDLGLRLLMRLRMALIGATSWRRFAAACRKPRDVQWAVLERILRENRDTGFGRQHHFGSIQSFEDFRRRVPVQDYDSLQPWIEQERREGSHALTVAPPVLYAQTSGTTAAPKYIPVLERTLREHQRIQSLFCYRVFRALPEAFAGRILAVVSPAVEGHLPGGQPFGSASGHIYRTMPRLARSKYVIPAEVFDLADYELKYQLIVRLAVAERNVTSLGSANPSTFLKLLDVLRTNRTDLLADLEAGSFARMDALPAAVRRAVEPHLACPPERLIELRCVLAGEAPNFADVWPHLRLVSTWTGGSCGIALESLRAALPAGARIGELGYLSSEFRGSLPVDLERCVPTLCEHFFEFVPKKRWEEDRAEFLTLDQLEEAHEYYVLVTTSAGLYRYFMNDLVRVTGRFGATPTLAFVQKGKGVTSITGEKLYESQVIQAVRRAEHRLVFTTRFLIALADRERACYRVLLESENPVDAVALGRQLDHQLAALNVEYAQKRASGRLDGLEVVALPRGAGEAYKAHCVARGQREGQFKVVALQYADEFDWNYGRVCELAHEGRSACA